MTQFNFCKSVDQNSLSGVFQNIFKYYTIQGLWVWFLFVNCEFELCMQLFKCVMCTEDLEIVCLKSGRNAIFGSILFPWLSETGFNDLFVFVFCEDISFVQYLKGMSFISVKAWGTWAACFAYSLIEGLATWPFMSIEHEKLEIKVEKFLRVMGQSGAVLGTWLNAHCFVNYVDSNLKSNIKTNPPLHCIALHPDRVDRIALASRARRWVRFRELLQTGP